MAVATYCSVVLLGYSWFSVSLGCSGNISAKSASEDGYQESKNAIGMETSGYSG
ncbi:hypothetical protein MGYG_07220 [Nannizzia gypsea CBS 118893]|uniref:Uncharacterized protein n=1 Tax=Arthroderma gypseum (strain ATCC MYA-4604 / CBS 118893) TaxID=535722 RepID=E4V2E8_ARTGP|nr:hypothetical protein MGYG_07220 [Nannizzia gypsea CBS 118893]EFR04213.1 hypothetical protein MGYG_07220 [Nannizzia gypsea CBS 118893]